MYTQWVYNMTKQKPPPVFCNVPAGATFSLGENKVAIKYHIFFVETRPILGAGFFGAEIGQKLSRNWASFEQAGEWEMIKFIQNEG